MKIYRWSAAMLAVVLFSSCVPQRQFQDLQAKYNETEKARKDCETDLASLREQDEINQKRLQEQAGTIQSLSADTARLGSTNRKLEDLTSQTNSAYDRLVAKAQELESANKLRAQELLDELKDAQQKLAEKESQLTQKESNLRQQSDQAQKLQSDLKKLQADLEARQKRVQELETVLRQKDSVVQALRNTVANALLGYKDQGLTVNVRNGKVYVSVEDKLLFESGKYQVNKQGQQALLDLAKVLREKQDINILVEGHTDSIPYRGSGTIKDNWDLSVLRATEVARILANAGNIKPQRITAAGRGETQPIASNATAEGRAKNRRTEIILTPQLGELFKILESN